ncbi:hypothetical protein DES53_103239 [Roseimicrobium gellanilyticum]|uniref:WD40 repeat protein n=1 Tax=Roseimicrobium gellanilyticum TaxID=748857 RepID=A0A366HPE7_9BACT|nr:hypothetical protein [Roseimicrobium gellanilyticum]RBP45241.1 hypothetical protein DES53_103239 [Roseimicrobium gellanilyticum]
MKKLFTALSALVVLALAGCLPEERFWWSPDGSHALMQLEDGLYLAGADGAAPVKLDIKLGNEGELASRASWLPDGSGFVVNRVLAFSKWEDAKVVIPPGEAAEVERLARGIPLLITAWNAAHDQKTENTGDVDDWLPVKNRVLLGAAFYLAYTTQRETLEAELRKTPKGEATIEHLREEEMVFPVQEICLVKMKDGKLDGEPRPLARSLRALVFPKISPTAKAVAFLHAMEEEDAAKLEVAMLDGSARLEAAHQISAAFDWTTDGHSLVYSAPVMGKDSNLQRIHRLEVLKADGTLRKRSEGDVAHPDDLKGPVTLALTLMPTSPRVIALPDGRVLFASQPVTFPAKGEGLEVALQLFTVTADGKTLTPVPTAPGDLPANLGWFTASPDGKKLAVVESDTDAVAVVEIDSGKTEIISPVHASWQCRTMPAWKSSTELTFAALKDGAPKWMLWKQGEGVRCISDSWPSSATARWLEEKKKEQPAEKSP